MLNKIELEREFILAIEHLNVDSVKNLLNKGVNVNITDDIKSWFVTYEIFERTFENNQDIDNAEEIIQLLLSYGLDIEFESEYIEPALNYIIGYGNCTSLNLRKFAIRIEKMLLMYGANPNTANSDGKRVVCESILESNDKDLQETKLLLDCGALIHIEDFPSCFALIQATSQNKKNLIKLLLDYGADTSIEDYDGNTALELLKINKLFDTPKKLLEGFKSLLKDKNLKDLISPSNQTEEENKMEEEMILDDSNDIKLTEEEYQELKTLLNPNNPPYLKLGKNETDKYIIYENKDIETNPEPHILANKQKHPNKKYLYADNKSDAFVYWAYKNNLLTESLEKVIKKYITLTGEVNAKNIGQLITSMIGEELTSDMFNVEGKPFAVSYLTVTHWWYNLHTDFNRLYQDENNRLPRAIKSQEEFDTLMKLLDIRYEQFKSGNDFNSNQNKAELQALIEGKEPPKRKVDLSWLVEHCGEDGVYDGTTGIKENEIKEENNDKGDDIIPDDFFAK